MSRAERGPVALVAALLALATTAWLVMDRWTHAMDMGPGTDLGPLGFYVTTWLGMTAAIMLPSAAPMVLVYSRIHGWRKRAGKVVCPAAPALFVVGYVAVWTAFGLAAYVLDAAIRSLSIDALSWGRAGPALAGGLVIAAAAFQLTSLKDRCLSTCRTPLDFVLGRWRRGPVGALRMGAEHGAFCVGCCWALMAALFALGVMSVGWMAFVAALIAIEKLASEKRLASRAIAVLLLALGLAVASAPQHVPMLTVPRAPVADQDASR